MIGVSSSTAKHLTHTYTHICRRHKNELPHKHRSPTAILIQKISMICPCSRNQPAVYLSFTIKNVCHMSYFLVLMAHSLHPCIVEKRHQISDFKPHDRCWLILGILRGIFSLKVWGCRSFLSDQVSPRTQSWNKAWWDSRCLSYSSDPFITFSCYWNKKWCFCSFINSF